MPRPKTSVSSCTREPSASSSYPYISSWNHSAQAYHWFFRASSSAGSPGTSSSRPGSSGQDIISPKQRRSTGRSRTCEQGGDQDAGDACARSSSSRRPPGAAGHGGGDWNASRTSLRHAVGLQRESILERSPAPPRPSSLPLMQGFSARKMRMLHSGRRPSFSGANTHAAERAAQIPLTPSKLVKRQSLGFVRLEFGGGGAQATEEKQPVGKYPNNINYQVGPLFCYEYD